MGESKVRTELYTKHDVNEIENIEGRVVVLGSEVLSIYHRKPEFQLANVTGGFGSKTNTVSGAVVLEFLHDGEKSRFERQQILGVLKDELLKELNK